MPIRMFVEFRKFLLLNYKTQAMKKIIFLLSVVILLSSGCKKSCDGVLCLNGGVCHDGICSCIGNYTGSNCGTPPVVPQQACVTNHVGTLVFTNNKDNPYFINEDNVQIATMQGHSYSNFTNHASGYHHYHCVQASGYILYPTVYDKYGTLSDCGTLYVSIP